MSDELNTQALKLIETFNKTSDVIPMVLQEYLMWAYVAHLAGIIMGTIFLIVAIFSWWKVIKTKENHLTPIWEISAVISTVVSFSFLTINIYYFAYAYVAPNAYIIDQLLGSK